MKKTLPVITILAILLMPGAARAALTFDTGTTDKVTVPNPQTVSAGSEFTYWVWHYRTDDTNGRGTGKIGAAPIDVLVNDFFVADGMYLNVGRTTTSADAESAANAFQRNVWEFAVSTYSESDGPRLFQGTLTKTVAEVSYRTRTVGSGSTDTADGDLIVGNRSAGGSGAFGGRIAIVGWVNRRLTLGELKLLQFFPHVISGTKFFGVLGSNGTTNVPDWSGNGKTGVITSLVYSLNGHVPIRWR